MGVPDLLFHHEKGGIAHGGCRDAEEEDGEGRAHLSDEGLKKQELS